MCLSVGSSILTKIFVRRNITYPSKKFLGHDLCLSLLVQNMTIGDMLGHEESMLKVWVDERRSRDVNAGLMWENLKLLLYLIPAIITIDTFFLQAIFDNELPENTSGFRFLIFLFPSLVITLSLIGESNLKEKMGTVHWNL